MYYNPAYTPYQAQPAYGSAQPAYGSAQPAYGSAQPAYGSAQPAYGSAQPAYGSAGGYAPFNGAQAIQAGGYTMGGGAIQPYAGYGMSTPGAPMYAAPRAAEYMPTADLSKGYGNAAPQYIAPAPFQPAAAPVAQSPWPAQYPPQPQGMSLKPQPMSPAIQSPAIQPNQEPDPDDDPNRLPTFVKVRGLPADHDPRIARKPKSKKRSAALCCA